MELLNRPLEDYLRHRFGPQAVLEHAVRFPRGSSRLTWFVDRRTAPGGPIRPLAFRGDFAGGATIHSSLEQEYFIYERLGNTAVPVAPVLWWEDDPAWAPRPFYVRARIEGSWEVPHFRDPDLRLTRSASIHRESICASSPSFTPSTGRRMASTSDCSRPPTSSSAPRISSTRWSRVSRNIGASPFRSLSRPWASCAAACPLRRASACARA